MANLSFLTAFEPQKLILEPNATWNLPFFPHLAVELRFLVQLGPRSFLGMITYAIACWIFVRRDLPVPR